MAIGLVGQKLGMTRIMAADGSATAVSVIKVEPNRVVQVKTAAIDGYNAVQITSGNKTNKKGEPKINRTSKALKGHYAKASQAIGLGLWEFKSGKNEELKTTYDVSFFSTGHFVDVAGNSKGKGFQGGVKRHNFQMQDATHGNSISHRALGSTGQCQTPGRVFKGKKMAGQMGNEQVSEAALEIIKIDTEKNLLLVKGAIPGCKNGFVRISLSIKKQKANAKISQQALDDATKKADEAAAKADEAAAKTEAEKVKVDNAKKADNTSPEVEPVKADEAKKTDEPTKKSEESK